MFFYRPDYGLTKPKHEVSFTLHCELCMTTWKNNYIFKVQVDRGF
jgi:hypothetical protein